MEGLFTYGNSDAFSDSQAEANEHYYQAVAKQTGTDIATIRTAYATAAILAVAASGGKSKGSGKLPLGGVKKQALLNELSSKGVKFSPNKVISISKTKNGQIVFLEEGNSKAGLKHIIDRHGDQFLHKGISEKQIPDLIMKAVNKGKIIGYQGKGSGRPIYEVTFNGEVQKVAITIGDNGYIVGANLR